MFVVCGFFFFERYVHHRDLHVLTHSFPTRRSSDLHAGAVAGRGLAVAAAQAVAVLVPPAHLPPARHRDRAPRPAVGPPSDALCGQPRSEEHTSELQSLMRTSYAVFCLKKKN